MNTSIKNPTASADRVPLAQLDLNRAPAVAKSLRRVKPRKAASTFNSSI